MSPDRIITIEVLDEGGFTVEWTPAAGDTRKVHAANRSVVGRTLLMTAIPEVRGSLPKIDEVIDIHAPQARRSGDS